MREMPERGVKRWDHRVRWWLVNKLVGKSSVIINVDIKGVTKLRYDKGVVKHNTFDGPIGLASDETFNKEWWDSYDFKPPPISWDRGESEGFWWTGPANVTAEGCEVHPYEEEK